VGFGLDVRLSLMALRFSHVRVSSGAVAFA
jgi:hypothetical protein